jgi:hypothetical protein
LFVAVAALAAWQFSARRDAAAIAQASPASAAASSTVAAVPSPPPTPIIIETPEAEPSTPAKDATKAPVPVPAPPVTATADTGARVSTVDRTPIPDAGAASSPRVRPPGKPVPRVGDEPALAANNNAAGTTRPAEPPTTASPYSSPNGDRRPVPSAPASRDAGGIVQHPVPGAEPATQSIRDVCKGSFFERNVCMDQRCEEARFRSTPDCAEVLDRKRRHLSQ